jgi:protein gp37
VNKTNIEWTDYTWNTTFGCTHVSDGCKHCYAESLALRFGHSKHPWTKPFELENVRVKPEKLREPFKIKEPGRVFVDSMSDLFHELVPLDHIAKVFAVMAATPHLTYQILTKRPKRMSETLNALMFREEALPEAAGDLEIVRDWSDHWTSSRTALAWPLPNVWLGTSVEDQRVVDRIDWLIKTPAAVRFLSCEPLIGPLDLGRWLIGPCPSCGTPHLGFCEEPKRFPIHWIITGGESGQNHRPFNPDWARSIRDQCLDAGVPFFFKQHGGRTPKAGGRELDGRTWDEFPEVA